MFNKLFRIFKNFSKTERYMFLGAILILVIASFFWLSNYFYGLTTEAPVRGGSYKEGVVGQPTTLNPLLAGGNAADQDLIELLFADLSELAENINTSNDYRTWTITLKEKLIWSDGEPLTTADVLFTLESIQNADTQSPIINTWKGVVAERLSDKEIRFSIPNPYAFFEHNLSRFKIVPRHIFANVPLSNLRLSNFNLEPVGSGPFKFLSYKKQKDGFISEYYLEANEDYANGEPYIQLLTVKFFKDANDAFSSLNRKEIDGLGAIDPENLNKIKISHKLFSVNIPRYYAIFINQSTSPELKKDGVREALSLAIDKSRIINTVFKNNAMIINGPIPPIIEGYQPEIYKDIFLFNPEAAENLLIEAKLKANEETNSRLELNIIVPQIKFLIDSVELIKEDFAKIGISLNSQIATIPEINEIIKTRNYQMIIFGNVLRGNPDIFSFWHSSERFYPGLNLSIYNNKKVDNLLESVRKEIDSEKRKSDLGAIQKLILEDNPAVFLFSPNYVYVAPKNLNGFEPKLIVTLSDRFENVNEWHLKTARVFK